MGDGTARLPADTTTAAERRVIMRLRDWADEIADAAGDVIFSSTAYETVLEVLCKARDDGAAAAKPVIAAEAARQERQRIRDLAVKHEAKYLVPCDEHAHSGTLHTHHRALFADLLEDAL